MPRFQPHPDRRPVFVAGASSGIGEATARWLASAGYPVVLGARRVEKCKETAEAIIADGGEAIAVFLDGWQFHKDSIPVDLAKRMAVAKSGKFSVWTLTWDDIETVLQGKDSATPSPWPRTPARWPAPTAR